MVTAAHQIITKDFWENERQKYDLYISQYVIDECEKGGPEAAKRRLDLIKGITMLPIPKSVFELAPIYKRLLDIPETANVDAFHLAISVLTEMDCLLTWNFKHMGIRSYGKLIKYNEREGLKTPLLTSPDIFLNNEENLL
jgi:hypothetical protein